MTLDPTIRIATSADLPALTGLADLAGTAVRWKDRLGDGATIDTPLTLVAETDHQIVGAICSHPLDITPDAVIHSRFGATTASSHTTPWWKLSMLAVVPSYEGRGIAHALLRHTVAAVPTGIDGLYGNVSLDRTRATTWYRRQGFYLAASMGLPGRTSRGGIKVSTIPGDVFFRGELRNLRQHLEGQGHPRSERRTATQEFKRAWRELTSAEPPARDVGYRLYARRLAARLATDRSEACPHMELGPRPHNVLGWDPNLHVACFDCWTELLAAAEPYDDDDLCDGCGQRAGDVQLSCIALDDEFLVVHAGLCPPCRAGRGSGAC
ncbi:GNAT family N-acetyltransferase [Isoptericola rhizosphaerae]|uniref:GNAT family N-acetyltransferase n=1 Tax=Isoptericola rhizosphaerae TaxID=3377837 RepID=UPI00383A98A2